MSWSLPAHAVLRCEQVGDSPSLPVRLDASDFRIPKRIQDRARRDPVYSVIYRSLWEHLRTRGDRSVDVFVPDFVQATGYFEWVSNKSIVLHWGAFASLQGWDPVPYGVSHAGAHRQIPVFATVLWDLKTKLAEEGIQVRFIFSGIENQNLLRLIQSRTH